MSVAKKIAVISAVNIVEGGTLTVLKDCVDSAIANLEKDWEVIVLINRKDLIDDLGLTKIVYSMPKKSWLIRMFYEWLYFYFLSKKLKPTLWLSMHDISPNVKAKKKAVYCHNPSPFYHYPFKDILISPKLWLFNKFYKYLYAINIQKNDFVIVQQSWLRDSFIKLYGELNVVVAYPSKIEDGVLHASEYISSKNIFLYPAFPRVFKNFEVICKAVEELKQISINDFEVILTIDGNENKYSRKLKREYAHLKNISFIGLQDKQSMDELYIKAKAIIFPSKVETWGLPITEAKAYNKNILLVDLPYARETIGDYDKVSFFYPNDARKLSDLMLGIIKNDIKHTGNVKKSIEQPFSESWANLWSKLTSGL